MDKRGLIIIPYAYGGNTGVSIQNVDSQRNIYMKNVTVAALSARENAGVNTDVMVVNNIEFPQPYSELLSAAGVMTALCPFDLFNFGTHSKSGEKVRWQLAFYKLCALAHCVERFNYDYFCFLDSDVFVQRSFDQIWEEAQHNIMLYDLNEPLDGYMVKEMRDFLKIDISYPHYGGEFFAASKALAEKFIAKCQEVLDEMLEAGYVTGSGDEFITSIAANRLKPLVKNAGAYITRYWTGSYRRVNKNYTDKAMAVLHVPAEKEQGILAIFDKYVSKGLVPEKRTAWKHLHLDRQSLRVKIGVGLRRLGVVK